MLVLWQLGRVVINMMLLFPLTQLALIPGNWGVCVSFYSSMLSVAPPHFCLKFSKVYSLRKD